VIAAAEAADNDAHRQTDRQTHRSENSISAISLRSLGRYKYSTVVVQPALKYGKKIICDVDDA